MMFTGDFQHWKHIPLLFFYQYLAFRLAQYLQQTSRRGKLVMYQYRIKMSKSYISVLFKMFYTFIYNKKPIKNNHRMQCQCLYIERCSRCVGPLVVLLIWYFRCIICGIGCKPFKENEAVENWKYTWQCIQM